MTIGLDDPYAARRERLLAAMDGAVAIFSAAPEAVRSRDVNHRYRPDSDFFYLTGFGEPGAYLVLDASAPKHRYTLYVQPRDPAMERWNGRRAGTRGARTRYGADAAHASDDFMAALPDLLAGHARVFLQLGVNPVLDQAVIDQVARARAGTRSGAKGPREIADPAPLLGEYRLIKSDHEIAALQHAVDVTADGHREALAATRPGAFEYEVEAAAEYAFRRAGAAGPAYSTICGSGRNATILHYVENSRRMRRGELLLIDAGAEVAGYCGDVTRTFPVSGRFSAPQRDLYEVVLAAQRAALAEVRPGTTFDAVHRAAVRCLVRGLIDLGLLQGTVAEAVRSEAYRRYYMHRTSHWLGLDVHDVGRYHEADGGSRKLVPGMVLTVEPGLYVDGDADIPRPFRHLGIRIEDDVLVTDTGHRVLSEAIPKDVDAIEQAMSA